MYGAGAGSINVNVTCNGLPVNPTGAQLIVNVPAVAVVVQLNRPELSLIVTPFGALVKVQLALLVTSLPILSIA
jgi:hypothetical protein